MKKFHYMDEKNFYPYADLLWEGAGWYATACSGCCCEIREVSWMMEEGAPYPDTRGTGYGTAMWADTPAQAAGNYAEYPA